jgi:hypothetical protein
VIELLLGGVEVPVPEGSPGVAEQLAGAAGERHRLHEASPDLAGFAASGLPARTMGRGIDEDRLFFAAALAAGCVLGARSLAAQGD